MGGDGEENARRMFPKSMQSIEDMLLEILTDEEGKKPMAELLKKEGKPILMALTEKLDVRVFAVLGAKDDWTAFGFQDPEGIVPNHCGLEMSGWRITKAEACEFFPVLNPRAWRRSVSN